MAKVNEVNMAKWIVALRSGKYRQAFRALHTPNGFCCMGVACDISGLGEWVADQKGMLSYRVAPANGGLVSESAGILPSSVASFFLGDMTFGESHNPRMGDISCSAANDVAGWDFNHIADGLEGTYLPGKKAEEILAEGK